MTETGEASATLKRKASHSPPAEDVTSKRVKEDVNREEASTDNSNGDTNTSNNGTAREKPGEQPAGMSPPPPKRMKRDADPPAIPLRTTPEQAPALAAPGLDYDGKPPEQARRPSESAGSGSEPGNAPGARKNIVLDEKKRAKRLFGGVLSTLSQRQPSSRQQKSRHEVDRRQQQERVEKEKAEFDKERAAKLAKLQAIRLETQDRLEEEIVCSGTFSTWFMSSGTDTFCSHRWKSNIRRCSPWHTVSRQEANRDW